MDLVPLSPADVGPAVHPPWDSRDPMIATWPVSQTESIVAGAASVEAKGQSSQPLSQLCRPRWWRPTLMLTVTPVDKGVRG